MASTVTLHLGDVRDVMATLPDDHADLLVTSPPFLALRSYLPADHPDKAREIGSEATPALFLDTLYQLTAEWGRLIPDWGSIAVELGDTMSGSGGAGGDYNPDGLRDGQARFNGSASADRRASRQHYGPGHGGGAADHLDAVIPTKGPGWPLAKSATGIPQAYYLGLIYGHNPLTGQPSPAGQWRARNWLTWARPNPPVGSLGKRNPHKRTGDQKFRPACSFITVACRGTGRYFDLDAVRTEGASFDRPTGSGTNGSQKARHDPQLTTWKADLPLTTNPAGAPPLDWHTDQFDGDWLWKLATAPYPGAHYATYPLTLPRRLILAMCPQRVCTVCGWPSERVTTSERRHEADDSTRLIKAGEYRLNGRDHPPEIGWEFDRTTLGWTDCGHDNWRPGRVLDPFAGSGTTAVAAAIEGRDCVLVDLDARNVELIDRRLRDVARVQRVDGGSTVTWTVEPLPVSQLSAEAAGQLALFGAW